MAKNMRHFFRDGTEHKGGTHKDAKGRLMSGARHTGSSKFLYHMADLSKTAQKRLQRKPLKVVDETPIGSKLRFLLTRRAPYVRFNTIRAFG